MYDTTLIAPKPHQMEPEHIPAPRRSENELVIDEIRQELPRFALDPAQNYLQKFVDCLGGKVEVEKHPVDVVGGVAEQYLTKTSADESYARTPASRHQKADIPRSQSAAPPPCIQPLTASTFFLRGRSGPRRRRFVPFRLALRRK
jgi:hypothetical protein